MEGQAPAAPAAPPAVGPSQPPAPTPIQGGPESAALHTTEAAPAPTSLLATAGQEVEIVADKPMLAGKYENVEALEKGYKELQAHTNRELGAFTGAPEEGYKFNVVPELKGQGVDSINMEDPVVKDFMSLCKENNINNQFANDLVNFYEMQMLLKDQASTTSEADYTKAQLKELGEDAPEICKNVKQWVENTFPKDMRDAVIGEANSSVLIKAFNYLRQNSTSNQPVGGYMAPKLQMSPQEILNEYKRVQYDSKASQADRQHVDNLMEQAFGA